jgi:hypothetical protein
MMMELEDTFTIQKGFKNQDKIKIAIAVWNL